ncbi:hypothetical protein V8C34DRAFT_315392 [Trichoderma compactum]
MHFIKQAFALGLVAASVTAFRIPKECPPFKGSFNVSVLDLYPESADWDPVHCKVYLGLLYNASVAVYDPYQQKLDEIITFPGITGNDDYTISFGIDYDGFGSMYFAATSHTAFQSAATVLPANFTGPNRIIRYDIKAHKVAWISSLTWPRIWYEPKNLTETLSSGGLDTIGDELIINDRSGKGFLIFDTRQPKGKPVQVPAKGFPSDLAGSDGLVAPQKYGGKVLLWADDPFGTRVFGSNDGWTSAEYLGLVSIDSNLQALGDIIYTVTEAFQAKRPVATMKEFQMLDIRDADDRLVKVWQVSCN